jgi:hypothetical protein
MLALGGRTWHAGTVGDVPGTVRPAGKPGGQEERDGPALGQTGATATAQPGGRLRRRPGGRQRVVGVRLSPEEEAWIVPRAAAEGLSVQRFLVESTLPEGRPSLLFRRTLCREFLAVARDFHGACVNLNQLTRLAHVRRDVPSGANEVMAEVRAGGRRIVELAALLSARAGRPPGEAEA